MTARIEPSLLGRMTEGQVLRVLQERGPLSRAEVARLTRLSAPAVSRAVVSLKRAGLLEEGTEAQATGGRPATLLRLARQSAQVLGVSIDADRCTLAAAALDGEIQDEPETFDTPDDYAGLIDELALRARRRMARPAVTTLGVGISLPGLIDYRTRRCLLSPNLHLTDGQSPTADLATRLGVECLMFQESHALCLAEQFDGQARGLDDFAMLDVHTGVGLGVVSGGRLLTGHSGLAGEIGHITVVPDGRKCGCGNRGCLETVANDTSLAWRVSRRLGRKTTIDDVIRLAQSGTDLSAELDDVCRYLALGVSAVINLFNPARLFVHGRLFECDPKLFSRMSELASRRTLKPSFGDCSIVRATASKHKGAVAGIIQYVTGASSPSLGPRTLCFPEVRHAALS
jgi:N-acetylglucosamine repressor